MEAFSLSANDLRYVTGHFLRNSHRMELRRALRFYSPHWRIWGALAIQVRTGTLYCLCLGCLRDGRCGPV